MRLLAQTQQAKGAGPLWNPLNKGRSMKDTVIKFRLRKEDKAKIERLAEMRGESVSEILRSALKEIQQGRVAGSRGRLALADARRSANAILQFTDGDSRSSQKFDQLLVRLRDSAREVLVT